MTIERTVLIAWVKNEAAQSRIDAKDLARNSQRAAIYATRAEQFDAIAALLEAEAWKDIYTAPKDGTKFLCYWPKDINGKEMIDMLGGWHEYESIIGFGEPPATHWRPLPAPPVTEAKP